MLATMNIHVHVHVQACITKYAGSGMYVCVHDCVVASQTDALIWRKLWYGYNLATDTLYSTGQSYVAASMHAMHRSLYVKQYIVVVHTWLYMYPYNSYMYMYMCMTTIVTWSLDNRVIAHESITDTRYNAGQCSGDRECWHKQVHIYWHIVALKIHWVHTHTHIGTTIIKAVFLWGICMWCPRCEDL